MILVVVVVVVVGPHQAKEEEDRATFLTETIKILEESLDILDRLTGVGHVMLEDEWEEWA